MFGGIILPIFDFRRHWCHFTTVPWNPALWPPGWCMLVAGWISHSGGPGATASCMVKQARNKTYQWAIYIYILQLYGTIAFFSLSWSNMVFQILWGRVYWEHFCRAIMQERATESRLNEAERNSGTLQFADSNSALVLILKRQTCSKWIHVPTISLLNTKTRQVLKIVN